MCLIKFLPCIWEKLEFPLLQFQCSAEHRVDFDSKALKFQVMLVFELVQSLGKSIFNPRFAKVLKEEISNDCRSAAICDYFAEKFENGIGHGNSLLTFS